MCTKRKFSERQANRVIESSRRSVSDRRKENRTYYCYDCRCYHVTSSEQIIHGGPYFKLSYKKRWKLLLNNRESVFNS